MRLDEYLVEKKLVKSRNLAKETIKKGCVLVNGLICTKPSLDILNQSVEVTQVLQYVSRAGLKLEKALETFQISVRDKVILDVGASTGGFSDCCLQNGAKKVYAIDVGTNQLDAKLIHDNRVVNIENLNVKDLNDTIIAETIDIVVSDISFISSKYMFEAIRRINLSDDCIVISLIKPQFELSPEIVAKHNGKILEQKYWDQAIQSCKQYAKDNQFKVMDICDSPIKGAKKQNQEYLMWCVNEKR